MSSAFGCRKGEELTISYGRHSDDIFYAFYGFLPDVNPHNTVELFRDTEDLAAFMEAEEGIPRSVTISSLPPGAANGSVLLLSKLTFAWRSTAVCVGAVRYDSVLWSADAGWL